MNILEGVFNTIEVDNQNMVMVFPIGPVNQIREFGDKKHSKNTK